MSHNTPENLKYTKEHEWCAIEGEVVTVGITDYAESSLGEIVFVELPEVGTNLDKDAAFGVVESIKSVSDLYSPVSGEVIESNQELSDTPESINNAPYDSWLIKIKASKQDEFSTLLDASSYAGICE